MLQCGRERRRPDLYRGRLAAAQDITMKHSDALRRVRRLFRKQAPAGTNPTAQPESPFSGPTLLEQEPDLAKESGQYTRDASAWAAGGHPVD
jgi:hypothetical protein